MSNCNLVDRIPYRLHEELGRGGTARVFRVCPPEYGRQAALKVALEDDPNTGGSFAHLVRREHHLIGGLSFPGLVRVVEASTGDPPYLLMDLCRGPTLDQCGRIGNLSVLLNVFSAIALNLEYLKANSIIHGDLKPHNVFLPAFWEHCDADQLFYVKLSDFSLGRFTEEAESERAGMGTVGYMAPETLTKSRTGFKSDLFALGVIAYQMVTGQHPFMETDTDPVKVSSRVREEDPPPLSDRRNGLPRELVDIIQRLLARQESDRPLSGWEVCQTLRRVGARYPFEKAFRPRYFFSSTGSRSVQWSEFFALDERQRRRLARLSLNDVRNQRLIATVNFRKGILLYDGDHFAYSCGIYWLSRLRRETEQYFQEAGWGWKRSIVRAAIVGDREQAQSLGVIAVDDPPSVLDPLLDLMRPLIRPCLIRKCSARMAETAEQAGRHELAARLFVQAGDLKGAERCGQQAAVSLARTHQGPAAVRLINQVVELADSTARLPDVRKLLMTKGDILKQSGEADLALKTYEHLVSLYQGMSPDRLLGETYKDLGDLYRIKQDCDQGLKALHKALEIYSGLDEELEASRTLNNIGNIHWIAGNLDQALRFYRRALQIQKRLEAYPEIASTLGNIGSIYAIKGRFRRSIHVMEISLHLKKDLGDEGEIARSLNNLGHVHHVSGRLEEAVSYITESLQINRRIGSKKEILYNLDNLTSVMITAGRLPQALPLLQEGMTLAEELGDKPHLGAFNLAHGILSLRTGRYTQAATYFDTVGATVKEIDDRMLEVRVTILQAFLRYLLGDHKSALERGRRALETARRIDDKASQLNALLVITRIDGDSRLAEHALGLADELHLSREKTLILFSKAAHRLAGKEETTDSESSDSLLLSIIEEVHEDIELPWLCNIAAGIMLSRSDYDGAAHYLDRGEQAAKAGGQTPEMVTTLSLQGQLQYARGDFERCFQSLKRALQICREIADGIEDETDRTVFQQQQSVVSLAEEIKRLVALLKHK